MKKITFLLILLLVTTINYSQDILLDENFDAVTVPVDWEAAGSTGTGTQIWEFGSGVVPGAVADFTTNAAIFDDDAAGDNGDHNMVWLWYRAPGTVGLDVSGYTKVTLEYDYALNVDGNGETLSVALWDGSSWIPIRVYNVDTDPTFDSIDITAALAANPGVNAGSLFIGFGYDDATSSWGYGAGIDNVKVTATAENDYCNAAIAVPVNAAGTGCTSPTIASNLGATDSSPFNGTPTCASFGGGDIWFTFTAPATGDVKIIVPEVGEWSSFGTALYVGGTCADTAELGCEVNFDINNAANVPSEVTYTGLTPGDSYVLRAWDFGNDNFGAVSFCIEEFDSTASVNDDIIDGLTLHPNPVNDLLSIDSQEEISKVTVFNLLGQEVISINPVSNNFNLDLSNLDSGIYIVKLISTENKESTRKIVKK